MSDSMIPRSENRPTDRDEAVLRMCAAVERLRQVASKQRLVARALNSRAASLELRANAIEKRAIGLRSGRSRGRDWDH